MSKELNRNAELSRESIYDVWDLKNAGVPTGSYFVPKTVTGEDYEAALISARNKLIALGFTTLEAKAIIGRQLF
jgi:hypothetical protein